MNPAAKVAAALAQYGRPMLLRRRVGTSSAYIDVTVKGVSQGYQPHELMGGIVQGDRKITISNAEIAAAAWPGTAPSGVATSQWPPKITKGDICDGGTVQGVETKYLGSDVLAHVLWVRG